MERPILSVRDPRVIAGALALFVFAAGACGVAFYSRFPGPTDELEHFSFIRALAAEPTLFPKYGHYFILSNDLSQWTTRVNYLAHPPFYYLLMAQLPPDVAVLRFADVALAIVGVACSIGALVKLAPTPRAGAFAVLLLAAFTRSFAVAGTINNDNLVVLETGLLLLALASKKDRAVSLALLLALAGWTKLNAFVAMALIVGFAHLFDILGRRAPLFGFKSFALGAGVVVGLAPTLANLMTLHAPVYVPYDFLFVPEAARKSFDLRGFLNFFVHRLGEKFPPVEGSFDATYLLAAGFAIAAATVPFLRGRARTLAAAFLGAFALFFMIHVFYAWRSFTTLGSLSDAQIRYYNVLWPGCAFALALALDRMLEFSLYAMGRRAVEPTPTPSTQA